MSEKPSRRLYIGNLSRRTSEKDIRYEFEKFGRIKDLVIKDYRFPFGFCEFESRDDAKEAKNHWHDKLFDDKRLIVSFAQKGERTGSSGRSSEYRKTRVYKGKWRLSVENLSSQVSWQDLKDAARKFGRSVCFAKTWTYRGENLGVVEYADKQDFEDALDHMQGMRLGGRRLVVYQEGTQPESRKRSRGRSFTRSRSASWTRSRQRGRYPRRRTRDSSRTRRRDNYSSRRSRRDTSESRFSEDRKRRRLKRECTREWSNSRSRSTPAKKRRAESPLDKVEAPPIGKDSPSPKSGNSKLILNETDEEMIKIKDEKKETSSVEERKFSEEERKSSEREKKPRESKKNRKDTNKKGSKRRREEREHSLSNDSASSPESRVRGRALRPE